MILQTIHNHTAHMSENTPICRDDSEAASLLSTAELLKSLKLEVRTRDCDPNSLHKHWGTYLVHQPSKKQIFISGCEPANCEDTIREWAVSVRRGVQKTEKWKEMATLDDFWWAPASGDQEESTQEEPSRLDLGTGTGTGTGPARSQTLRKLSSFLCFRKIEE
jgi:hypothetical protein